LAAARLHIAGNFAIVLGIGRMFLWLTYIRMRHCEEERRSNLYAIQSE
jgi:hypothetical protein